MNVSKIPALLAPLAAMGLLISGCATTPAAHRSAWTPNRQVVATVAPYWRVYPPDSHGLEIIPNQTLGRGTPVRFLGHRLGFSEVQMPDLERGWVPRGTLGR